MPRSPAIISLEEFTESINMVVYADSGTGKTVLAGSAKKGLFLATENGTLSAKRQGSTSALWKINNWTELGEAYIYLRDNPDHGYDWVMIDSVTHMQKLCMRFILDKAVEENKSRDPDIPALQDWQKYYNMFQRFIVNFNDLPVNVLYTATTMRSEDEEGEQLVLPDLQGKGYSISQALCASVGIVAYMKKSMVGKGEDAESARKLLFESMPPYFAKDRYGVFPRWLTLTQGDRQVNTLDSITRMISGDVAPRKAAPAKKVAPAPPARRPLRAAK